MKKKPVIAAVSIAILAAIVLVGCDLFGLGVVGKWSQANFNGVPNQTANFQFKADGTFTYGVTNSNGTSSQTGTYTKTSSEITLTLNTDVYIYDYTVDATTLTFKQSGTTLYSLTRQK